MTEHPGPCRTCRWWSDDDDDDGRGSCAVLLNYPEARGWRTKPEAWCVVEVVG